MQVRTCVGQGTAWCRYPRPGPALYPKPCGPSTILLLSQRLGGSSSSAQVPPRTQDALGRGVKVPSRTMPSYSDSLGGLGRLAAPFCTGLTATAHPLTAP